MGKVIKKKPYPSVFVCLSVSLFSFFLYFSGSLLFPLFITHCSCATLLSLLLSHSLCLSPSVSLFLYLSVLFTSLYEYLVVCLAVFLSFFIFSPCSGLLSPSLSLVLHCLSLLPPHLLFLYILRLCALSQHTFFFPTFTSQSLPDLSLSLSPSHSLSVTQILSHTHTPILCPFRARLPLSPQCCIKSLRKPLNESHEYQLNLI